MNRLKLQHKTLIIKIYLLVTLFIVVFQTSSKALVNENSSENSLQELYNSVRAYIDNGDYSTALRTLDEIINRKREFDYDSMPEYFKIYNRYGLIYKLTGKCELAVNYYEKALNHTENTSNKAWVLMNIGNVYTIEGDFNSAIIYYNKVLDIASVAGSDRINLLADAYYNIGKAYDHTKQNQLALKYYLLSEKTRKNAKLPADGETFLNCASIYNQLGNTDSAEFYHHKAIQTEKRLKGGNHYMVSLANVYYAVFLTNQKQYNKALNLFNENLNILINTFGSKHQYISYCYMKIGELYMQLDENKIALEYFQKSLIAREYGFNDKCIYSNPQTNVAFKVEILDILMLKALAFENLAFNEEKETNLLAAFKTLELKIKLIEQLRIGYLYENTKLKLSEIENDTYIALIRITHKLYVATNQNLYAEAAFKYSEKSKYAVLLESVNKENAMTTAQIPPDLISYENSLRGKINRLRMLIEEESHKVPSDKIKTTEIKNSLYTNTQSLEVFTKELEQKYPLYYKLKTNNNVIEIKELQTKLYQDQVALEYVLTDSALFTFYITKNDFSFDIQKTDSDFYMNLDFFNDFLHSQYSLSYDTFRIAGYELYKYLIAPYEEKIQNKSLLIIPDEKLTLIAFEVLIDEPYRTVENVHYGKEPYIIRKYPIGYAYSSSIYVNSLKSKEHQKNNVLVLAPDYLNSKDSLPTLPIPKNYFRNLTRFSGKLLFGEDATETNFKELSKAYNILHIYAHGYEDSISSSLSRIILSDKNDSLNDGYLFAHEISNLKINADLVVLASCYSGSGLISKGEGVLSLGRSFLNTQTKSIVLSLWSAAYDPTISQLKSFNKYLLQGKRKDKAMQLAKLDYLENSNQLTSRPRYWASIVVIGNQEPLYTKSRNRFKIIGVILLVSLIVFITIKPKIK